MVGTLCNFVMVASFTSIANSMGLFKFTVKLNSTEISDMEQKELEDDLKLKQELEGNKQYRNLLTYNISEDNMDKFNNDYSSVLHMEYKNSNYSANVFSSKLIIILLQLFNFTIIHIYI